MDIPHSRSIDAFVTKDRHIKIPGTDGSMYTVKPSVLEKKFITNLSASRIDELNKRVTEQDIIINNQTKRIDELEHKLSMLMDILERNNDIWFHWELSLPNYYKSTGL